MSSMPYVFVRAWHTPRAMHNPVPWLPVCTQDTLTGVVRVERGEQLVFPTAFEVRVDTHITSGIRDCIDLQAWEYCVVQDRTTGTVGWWGRVAGSGRTRLIYTWASRHEVLSGGGAGCTC